ncbi:GreA/GreB family elongation factor [Carboxylicivirga sp. N1Y90]|uniref:GreA/GreB family elongation factor n=1 Tax=Carboxylicivirga fragile TaxID=3417571 RepID=UPI003D32C2E9|nr:GreA/GreB family elongation factor [Marinilabiliaceae bacterium N1Y90]
MDTKKVNHQNEKSFSTNRKAITDKDYFRIMNLVGEDIGKAHVLPESLHKLYLYAANSKKYKPQRIPQNYVTLNSEIILSNENDQKQLVKIVLPQNIYEKHDISVYSLLGLACIGAKEHDFIYVNYSGTKHKLLIEEIVFQPEKEKKFNL